MFTQRKDFIDGLDMLYYKLLKSDETVMANHSMPNRHQ